MIIFILNTYFRSKKFMIGRRCPDDKSTSLITKNEFF